jgi:hypothetical protein
MLTTVLDIKFTPKQYLRPTVSSDTSLGNTGSAGRGVPKNGSPVKKYTSSTAVKTICSPRTMKQCRSRLHIQIRNCRRYSYARINRHSNNFSNPQAAKVARTPGSSIATTSLSWDQSYSHQPTNIMCNDHLQPYKTVLSQPNGP